MSELVGIRECARRLGIAASTISRQVAAGAIPNRGTERNPLVDVEEARVARLQNLDLMKQRLTAGAPAAPADEPDPPAEAAGGKTSFNTARTARETIQARLAQLDLEERLGKLVDRAEVEDLAFEIGQAVRDGMAQRLDRMAARIVGLDDPVAIAAIIVAEDRALLAAIADLTRTRLEPPAEATRAAA